ncbi:MAG: M14 family zinc carboxypeptidase [Actinomycetes bacterium]
MPSLTSRRTAGQPPARSSRRAAGAAIAAAALSLGALSAIPTAAEAAPSATETSSAFPIQIVRVATPTGADKDRLLGLNLDLTEHAGANFVEAVLHTAADADALTAAGLTYDVTVPDLALRTAQNNRATKAYADSVASSPLPSGRDTYRTLADYNDDLRELAAIKPGIVERFALPHQSLEGRTVYGIEISDAVSSAATSSKPVFLMMGVHHAREWPSGESAMEFAYDLVKNHGSDARITDLLKKARVIVVPVVNVDGFNQSITQGSLLDLREVDNGGTVSILGTPGNAYKRKNCRVADGADSTPPGACDAAASPGGFGIGVDPNRNYGGFWGGPGASEVFADPTYRGGGPFSEPETQNIRELVSGEHVTTLITNHTFSNLVLRPPGLREQGDTADETIYADLGARMAAQSGYTNQHSYQLYDTTGTTEDWSYYATGGLGFTFEIGEEFHPPFPTVVDQYLGSGAYAGKGNREAYLIALENTAAASKHSVVSGKAPAGATLRLRKQFATPTYDGSSFTDRLDTTMTVPANGSFSWHVNPSTRPLVMKHRLQVLSETPTREQTYTASKALLPTEHEDVEFAVTETGQDLLQVELDWPTPDDLDLEVYFKEADGSLTEVASSGNFVGEKELATLNAPQPGTYVLRVINFASVSPTWTMTAGLYDTTDTIVGDGLVENWTLTCERPDGTVLQTVPVVVDRGQQVKPDLSACRSQY